MKYGVIIGFLILSFNLNAETLKTTDENKSLCRDAVESFSKNKVEESFNILQPYWPLPKQELDNLSYQTKTQLATVSGRFGNSIGSDFIKTQEAGSSFIQHTYAIKFEKHALRFVCLFYKPKKDWVVNAVHWDDQTSLFFN